MKITKKIIKKIIAWQIRQFKYFDYLIMKTGFVLLFAISPLFSADTVYTVTKSQLLARTNDLNYKLEQFKTTLEGSQSGVSGVQLKILMETQQDLSQEAYSLAYIRGLFGEGMLPDEFYREVNSALTLQGQNAERVKNISRNIEHFTTVEDLISIALSVLRAYMPAMENLIGGLFTYIKQ